MSAVPDVANPVSNALSDLPVVTKNVRVAFVLQGLHRVTRGAEVAFESVANELAAIPGFDVTLIGSGQSRPGQRYRYIHSPCTPREKFERWPKFPPFRSEYIWEEATFARRLGRVYDPSSYDATVTCSYPFVNWLLRAKKRRGGGRPVHVFVTENGDWPVQAGNREYRWFGCDGLICINPVMHERNKDRYKSWLIPNAVDMSSYVGAVASRAEFEMPATGKVVVIVSALIGSKRVLEGVRAVAAMEDVHLMVVGDGPLRDQVDAEGKELMGSRFRRARVPFDRMPALYRSADALLHMSKDEPFGNIYVEALAAGLPVVTHDWTSTRWLFERHAELVDTDSPEAVRAGIRKAIQENSAAAAAGRVELVKRRYTWKAVAEGYAQCLRTLLQT